MVCRKGSDRLLKKNAVRAKKSTSRPLDTAAAVARQSSMQQTRTPAAAAETSSAGAAAQCVPGQLTVRRLPRTDIDALMLGGLKDLDVIWHSAAEAAEAMRRGGAGPSWKAVTVVGAVKRATRKFIAKKTVQQQRRLIQQLAAAAAGDGDDDVGLPVTVDDGQRPTLTELPAVDQRAIGAAQSCRTDLLKHLLSSAPLRPGVTHNTYE